MKKRLTNINPLKLGIVLGILYGIISVIFVVPIFLLGILVSAIGAKTGNQALPMVFSGIFVIFLPVIYAILGFIGGIIAGFIYNLVVKWTGGIEFTTEEVQ